MGKTVWTETIVTEAGRGVRRVIEYPPLGARDNISGGKYRMVGSDTEENAAKHTEWSREETEESASEEEADTAGGAGESGLT